MFLYSRRDLDTHFNSTLHPPAPQALCAVTTGARTERATHWSVDRDALLGSVEERVQINRETESKISSTRATAQP